MHSMTKIYQEHAYSWAVQCSCGWKEKGADETAVRRRFDAHQKMPNHNQFKGE